METIQTICWWIGKIIIIIACLVFLFGIGISIINFWLTIRYRTWIYQMHEYKKLKSVLHKEKKANYIHINWKQIEHLIDIFENKKSFYYRDGFNLFRKRIIKILKESQNSELYVLYKQTK